MCISLTILISLQYFFPTVIHLTQVGGISRADSVSILSALEGRMRSNII